MIGVGFVRVDGFQRLAYAIRNISHSRTYGLTYPCSSRNTAWPKMYLKFAVMKTVLILVHIVLSDCACSIDLQLLSSCMCRVDHMH